jgi:hypothetical protein
MIRCTNFRSLPNCLQKGLTIAAPPSWPLYPEPASHSVVKYGLLRTENLPRKFHYANRGIYDTDECTVVYQDGGLQVEKLAKDGVVYSHGNGQKWSHLPWTEEQESSCRPLKVKLRFWNSGMVTGR